MYARTRTRDRRRMDANPANTGFLLLVCRKCGRESCKSGENNWGWGLFWGFGLEIRHTHLRTGEEDIVGRATTSDPQRGGCFEDGSAEIRFANPAISTLPRGKLTTDSRTSKTAARVNGGS